MEAKLTAKDLMIGDWVLCVDSTHKNKVYAKIDAIEEGQRSILLRKGNTNWFLLIDVIEPIPLTAEILEKNGFKYNDCPIVLGWEQYGLTLYRGGDGFLINCGQNVALIINCVHQLQHVLRLCGINDKEIVL